MAGTYTQTQAGDWNTNATWGGSGHPAAGDIAIMNSTFNMTIGSTAACATLNMTGYSGTMTGSTFVLTVSAATTLQGAFAGWTTGGITITGGGLTLAATPTGTAFPIIKFTTALGTLTSGGFTYPGQINFAGAFTYTLVGNWITSGLTTISAAANINKTTAETYTANGGVTLSASSGTTGTAQFILGGAISGNYTFTSNHANGLTFSSGATVAGTTTFTVTAGGVTLNGNVTGANTVNLNLTTANQTLTSNGYTWAGKLSPALAGQTITFNGNWVNYGQLALGSSYYTFAQHNGTDTLTLYNGLAWQGGSNNSLTGAVPIYLAGGTWADGGGNDSIRVPLTIQPSYATVVISGTVVYSTGTLTYVASTYGVTTTGSTLSLSNTGGAPTLNTNTLVWNNISWAGFTVTLTSALNCSGTLTINTSSASAVVSGAYNVSVGTLSLPSAYGANYTITFTGGITLTVNTGMVLGGGSSYAGTLTSSNTTPINLVYLGSATNLSVAWWKFNYVNANTPIYDWGQTASYITNCVNIFPGNQSFIGVGFFMS
jgi:hypothetical protein